MKPAIRIALPVLMLIAAVAGGLCVTRAAARPYDIDRRVSIRTPDGATLSAIVVRAAGTKTRRPAALMFTIYPDVAREVKILEYAADRGYVGVVAFTRGKAYSPQTIVPYEDDGRDANTVISWIAKQPWSDGRVGMFGGSYNGFTQWAAAKHPSPALKTIVPWVPNNPGNGLPMQNNVFLLVNYAWIYYVTDNKWLDDAVYAQARWNTLNERWYRSGRAYRDVDAVAGVPNPWLHRWLAHPSYDAYWQAMTPYRSDYAHINFPVLTVTGYYGDSTAIGFFNDLQTFNPHANDYLVIGPWDHFGTQWRVKPPVLRGYRIDPVAHIDTLKLTFDWFDYVLRGKPRPALVANRVNYEVMGENAWKHAPSLDAMGTPRRLYLTASRAGTHYRLLSAKAPAAVTALSQTVDLADRKTSTNVNSYPDPIVGQKLDFSSGYAFVTEPFERPAEVSGFDGVIRVIINKRDVDVGLVLYEVMPNGKLFELAYFTQRASYAHDMSKRSLLTPGRAQAIPFARDYLFSRLFSKGSRLLLTVNVNKNAFAEINYGTGKDVAAEDIRDAGAPLQIRWLTGSYITIRTAKP